VRIFCLDDQVPCQALMRARCCVGPRMPVGGGGIRVPHTRLSTEAM
jgi:hypothetical protein